MPCLVKSFGRPTWCRKAPATRLADQRRPRRSTHRLGEISPARLSRAAQRGHHSHWTLKGGNCMYLREIQRPISPRLHGKGGAYKRHFQLTSGDWHDWDVSNTPALIQTRGGRRLLSAAPKDGHLYGIDLDTNTVLYRTPVNTIENADVPFSTD